MSEYYKDIHKYDDIINLPHHQSPQRAHMSLYNRAAQFAPFAALTGHEEAIEETARITDEKKILDETALEKINEILLKLSKHLHEKKNISITYFKPDIVKSGGEYLTDIGYIKKIDEQQKVITMNSGIKISMKQIIDISILDEDENSL